MSTGRLAKKPSDLVRGQWYSIHGKNVKGLPFPTQIFLVKGDVYRRGILGRDFCDIVSYVSLGDTRHEIPGILSLWDANIPDNGEALCEVVILDSLGDAKKAMSGGAEYVDIMEECPR